MTGLSGQVEIADDKQSRPEHHNGSVANIITGVSIVSATTDSIQLAFIKNPSKGTNANPSPNNVLYINIDGTTTYISLNRGESVYIPGAFTTLKITASSIGVNSESIIWS